MYLKSKTFILVGLVLISAFTVAIYSLPASSASSGPSPLATSQPNPSSLQFTFSVTYTWGGTHHVGDNVTASVTNFPASQQVEIYLGPVRIGTMSTDSTGYGTLTSTIPAMPGGNYIPVAQVPSQGLYAQSSMITISPYFKAMDTSNNMLNVVSSSYEYVPANATLKVLAYGLTPGTSYDATDQLAAPSGVNAAGLVTSVTVGTASSSGIYAATNGTLAFRYSASYTTHTTSSVSGISLSGASGYKGYTFAYKTIGNAVISSPSSFSITTQSASLSITITGLIPSGARVYQGVSYYYSLYLGRSILTITFSSTSSTRLYTTSGTLSGSFIVPSFTGLFRLNVTYYGQSYTSPIGTSYLVISSTASSPSSGTLKVVSQSTGFKAVGYGYENSPVPTLYYMTYSGSHSMGVGISNGAFVASFNPGSEPSGIYSVFTRVTVSPTNYFVYSSYSVSSVLTISTPLLSSSLPGGPVGASLSASATGLLPVTYYKAYFGTIDESTSSLYVSDSTGTISAIAFKVPDLPAGNYTVSLVALGSSTPSASVSFEILSNAHVVLSTSSSYAFPGQLVQFSVSGLTPPTLPTTQGFTTIGTPSYSVTVSLNNTPYVTVPAALSSSALRGSFLMPNNASGSYYMLSFSANETVSATYGTSYGTNFTLISLPFIGYESTSIELVSGNGAYILGVSSSQIAQIDASINSTLSVPLSQLDAAISSINGDIATVTTEFGTMSVTLSSINATVTSIQSGVASINTVLGTLNASLTDLNATVMLFHKNIAILNTSLGQQSAALNAINTTVTILNGRTAVIETDLGTFNGKVTSVSDGISTIQTSLGTIKTNTNQIVPTGGASFLLEIIILILVAIAVILSVFALLMSREIAGRFGIRKE